MNAVRSSAVAGASARAAEPADLCAHRRRAGGGRRCCTGRASQGGGLWLRWLALAIFIAAGVTDILDGYFARIWGQQSSLGRMLDPIADKLLVASCLLMLAADDTIRGWSLLGGDHHPVPRNPGVGPARISRRTARQRAGDAARQMEDHRADGRGRLPDRRARPATASLPAVTQIGIVLLWAVGAADALHRLGLSCAPGCAM